MGVSEQIFGCRSETQAARYLEGLGYTIVSRNVRTPLGEIDIIAKEGGEIVFVEVKARRSLLFGRPEEAVGKRKQRTLCRAALYWLKAQGAMSVSARFDVVAIVASGKNQEIEVIQNAFPLASLR